MASFTEAELDAAIAAIGDPGRLREAQEIVERSAPSLQRVLATALSEGGWFDAAHDQAVREVTGSADPEERERAVRTLLAEETRLGMLVGVAVGFELARELGSREARSQSPKSGRSQRPRQSPGGSATQTPSETQRQED